MSPYELAKACADRLNTGSELATRIQLVIPAEPRGERIRLDRTSRRKCPMGEVLCWTEEHGTVALFDAADVLAWLIGTGQVEMRVHDGDSIEVSGPTTPGDESSQDGGE